jgi:hypothetical protein
MLREEANGAESASAGLKIWPACPLPLLFTKASALHEWRHPVLLCGRGHITPLPGPEKGEILLWLHRAWPEERGGAYSSARPKARIQCLRDSGGAVSQ